MSTLVIDTLTARDGGPSALTGQSAARSMIRFDGSGPTDLESFGHSSLVDNGTGNTTFNLSITHTNANHVTISTTGTNASITRGQAQWGPDQDGQGFTASAVQLFGAHGASAASNGLAFDCPYGSMLIHGDLA